MSALLCDVDLVWASGQKFGKITVGDVCTRVSEPRVMGGTGAAMNPEDLFVAAAVSSYSVTLAGMLRVMGLPQSALAIHGEGLVVTSDAGAEKFTTVTLRPTIKGADLAQRQAYGKATIAARNHCFIGRSIRGNVAYVVGKVSLVGPHQEAPA